MARMGKAPGDWQIWAIWWTLVMSYAGCELRKAHADDIVSIKAPRYVVFGNTVTVGITAKAEGTMTFIWDCGNAGKSEWETEGGTEYRTFTPSGTCYLKATLVSGHKTYQAKEVIEMKGQL